MTRKRISSMLHEIGEPAVYCLKVSLKDIRPAIWRRFRVRHDITLNKLHQVIQRVMGWPNSHLHRYTIEGEVYMPPDPDEDETQWNYWSENMLRLGELVIDVGTIFEYRYDFGDSWDHKLVLEAIAGPDSAGAYPVCVAGERNCPPEDCGGAGGYEDLIRILKNPSHPEHQEKREWLGGGYDPETFSLWVINDKLKTLQRKRGAKTVRA